MRTAIIRFILLFSIGCAVGIRGADDVPFLGAVARHVLLSESTTEKVKERLLRLLQKRQERPSSYTLTGIPLPPSIPASSLSSPSPLLKLIGQNTASSSPEAFGKVVTQGSRKAVKRFWNAVDMRQNPQNVYSLLAVIYLVVTIQRRWERLWQTAVNMLSTMDAWTVAQGTMVAALVAAVGVSYMLGLGDHASLVRYAVAGLVAELALAVCHWHFRHLESSNESTGETETNETMSITTSILRNDTEFFLRNDTDYLRDAPAFHATALTEVCPTTNALADDEAMGLAKSDTVAAAESPTNDQLRRPFLNEIVDAHFKTVQAFVSNIPKQVMGSANEDAMAKEPVPPVEIDAILSKDVAIAGLDSPLQWNTYAFAHDDVKSPRVAFLYRYHPAKVVEGFVAAVSGTLLVASYAVGLPLLPLLHDAIVSILTWSLGGWVYDRLLSQWTAANGTVSSETPLLAEKSLAPWSSCRTTLQDAEPPLRVGGSFAAPHVSSSDILKGLLTISHETSVAANDGPDSEVDSIREHIASGSPTNTSSVPPFQIVEMSVSSSSLFERPDAPLDASVAQTQFFQPVQHLLRALLVAGGAAAAATTASLRSSASGKRFSLFFD